MIYLCVIMQRPQDQKKNRRQQEQQKNGLYRAQQSSRLTGESAEASRKEGEERGRKRRVAGPKDAYAARNAHGKCM